MNLLCTENFVDFNVSGGKVARRWESVLQDRIRNRTISSPDIAFVTMYIC